MAIGNPVLLSSTNEISADGIRPISFSRQDQSSFNETLLQEIVDLAPEVLPIRDFYPAVTSVCSLPSHGPAAQSSTAPQDSDTMATNRAR